MSHLTVGVLNYRELGDYDDTQILYGAHMKSYKKWWKLYKFELFLGEGKSLYGGEELVFIRQ